MGLFSWTKLPLCGVQGNNGLWAETSGAFLNQTPNKQATRNDNTFLIAFHFVDPVQKVG